MRRQHLLPVEMLKENYSIRIIWAVLLGGLSSEHGVNGAEAPRVAWIKEVSTNLEQVCRLFMQRLVHRDGRLRKTGVHWQYQLRSRGNLLAVADPVAFAAEKRNKVETETLGQESSSWRVGQSVA